MKARELAEALMQFPESDVVMYVDGKVHQIDPVRVRRTDDIYLLVEGE